MSDVSSSEEAFFLVCKYLLTMNPPESILNPIQIIKGVPGFIVTLYQIAGQNRMCMIISHILFLLFGWIPKEGDSPSWPEESKETGGFVAGNPTGTASPWHTTLLAKSSVLYLCEGAGSGRLVLPEGIGQKKTGAAGIAERLQRKAAAWASTGAKGYRSRCASLPP